MLREKFMALDGLLEKKKFLSQLCKLSISQSRKKGNRRKEKIEIRIIINEMGNIVTNKTLGPKVISLK